MIVVEHGAGRCKHAVAADEHAQRSAGVKVVADASSQTDGQLRLPMFGEVRLKTHAVTEVHAVGDVDSSVAVDLRTLAEINMAADVRALHAQPGGVQHRLKTPPCPHDAKAALVSRHQSNLAGSEIRCGGFVVAGFVGH